MKKIALALAVTAPFAAQAETIEIEKPEFYGKFNVVQEFVQQETGGSYSQLNSNASRLGVKGKIALDGGLTAIYQAEYETFIDDGQKAAGQTITQRNTFVGIESSVGTLQAGMFDTPMKLSQNKVDLFNDLQGDIKNVISGNAENRSENSVQYTSPSLSGVVLAVDHINSEDKTTAKKDNGLSASVAYTRGGIYLAYAYDNAVVIGSDLVVSRVVGQYTVGGLQLGALWETQNLSGTDTDGWMASASYKLNSTVALKAQYGESDMKKTGGQSYSIGADYKLAKAAKAFVYATAEDADAAGSANQYYGAGVEYKF